MLYPVVKEVPEAELPDDPAACTPYTQGYDRIFLSMNRLDHMRLLACLYFVLYLIPLYIYFHCTLLLLYVSSYERKKNILLAISALQHYKSLQQPHTGVGKSVLLVVAGGYDTRVQENVDYLQVDAIFTAINTTTMYDYCMHVCIGATATLRAMWLDVSVPPRSH